MTLREAVDRAEETFRGHIEGMWLEDEVEAFRLVLDTARQHLDDTAEIVLPCRTCGGKGEVVHAWERMRDGTAAVSPCPTCSPQAGGGGMNWTKTAPTQPGYYWYRHFKHPGKIGHVWLDRGTGKLLLFEFDGGGHTDIDFLSCEWAGPIPEPVEVQS